MYIGHFFFFLEFFAESGQIEFLKLSGNVVPTFGNDIIVAHFVRAGIGFHNISRVQLYKGLYINWAIFPISSLLIMP